MADTKNATKPAPTATATKAEKAKKIPFSLLEAQVKSGAISQQQMDALVKAGVVTSGDGGGASVREDLPALGVSKADVDAFYALAEKITNIIKGKTRASNERKCERVGIWIKHEGEEKSA
jgi:hypothetical protein